MAISESERDFEMRNRVDLSEGVTYTDTEGRKYDEKWEELSEPPKLGKNKWQLGLDGFRFEIEKSFYMSDLFPKQECNVIDIKLDGTVVFDVGDKRYHAKYEYDRWVCWRA